MRILSLLLTVVLILALIPVSASAALKDPSAIEQQIRSTYRTALRRTGKSSFNGFCGSFVNWQTCLLGIDDHVYGCDGKNEYDMYRDMGTTTGGYRVKCYPAGQYDLRSALNAITCNGTVDAYNILVGFQRTNTAEGSIYGHAVLIHAILDGEIYFAESYTASIGGKYWAEGTPIRVSIDTFCDYYNAWTVFDGVAYFGVKSYADVCQEYPASMYAMATEDLNVYSEPSDPGVHEAEKTDDAILSGEIVKVTGLLQTPGGGYWYRVERFGYEEYVPVESMAFVRGCEDVQVSQLWVPTALRRGAGFVLRGTVSTQNSRLTTVEVKVYDTLGGQAPVLSGSVEATGNAVSLNTGKLDRALTFRTLPAGTYQIAIYAQMQSYVLENGAPVLKTKTLEVYRAQMQIITGWGQYATVTFDGSGGQAPLQQSVVQCGDAIGKLPTAYRPGYLFMGWSLCPTGTQMVTDSTVISKDATLYAQWKRSRGLTSGWQQEDASWRFYSNGKVQTGWFTSNGLTFYVHEDGTPAWGWEKIRGEDYYFNTFGVMQTGWVTIEGVRYYLYEDGGKATGWTAIDGSSCYFTKTGKLVKCWDKNQTAGQRPADSDTVVDPEKDSAPMQEWLRPVRNNESPLWMRIE